MFKKILLGFVLISAPFLTLQALPPHIEANLRGTLPPAYIISHLEERAINTYYRRFEMCNTGDSMAQMCASDGTSDALKKAIATRMVGLASFVCSHLMGDPRLLRGLLPEIDHDITTAPNNQEIEHLRLIKGFVEHALHQ